MVISHLADPGSFDFQCCCRLQTSPRPCREAARATADYPVEGPHPVAQKAAGILHAYRLCLCDLSQAQRNAPALVRPGVIERRLLLPVDNPTVRLRVRKP
jgi:hypothetical protein